MNIEKIPEENFVPKGEESKHSNPYSNIEVEEVTSVYGTDKNTGGNKLTFKDFDKNKAKIVSDKKRAPTVSYI